MVKGKLERLLDATQKIFEGDVRVEFYLDRMIVTGTCWHCRSKTTMQTMFENGEGKQLMFDPQFKQNLIDMAGDDLMNDHQCGLLHDGKDVIDDVFSQVGKQ